jgi:hypothetical protein
MRDVLLKTSARPAHHYSDNDRVSTHMQIQLIQKPISKQIVVVLHNTSKHVSLVKQNKTQLPSREHY